MSNHLWYLSQECVSLAFFDSSVPEDVKQKMRAALDKPGWEEPNKRFSVKPEDLKTIILNDLAFFVSQKSLSFFERFSISTDFLSVDVACWKTPASFPEGLAIVKSIQVINDVAERAAALSQDFKNILTESEVQRGNMLLVSEHRRLFPDFRKATLAKNFMQKWFLIYINGVAQKIYFIACR